jgi:hypothetical protein
MSLNAPAQPMTRQNLSSQAQESSMPNPANNRFPVTTKPQLKTLLNRDLCQTPEPGPSACPRPVRTHGPVGESRQPGIQGVALPQQNARPPGAAKQRSNQGKPSLGRRSRQPGGLGGRPPRRYRDSGKMSAAHRTQVGEEGFEPSHPFGHTDLNRARLPFRHSPEWTT